MEGGNKLIHISVFMFLSFFILTFEEKRQLITQLVYGNSSDFQHYFIRMEIGDPSQLLLLVLDSQINNIYLLCKNICRGCSDTFFQEFDIESILKKNQRLLYLLIA